MTSPAIPTSSDVDLYKKKIKKKNCTNVFIVPNIYRADPRSVVTHNLNSAAI